MESVGWLVGREGGEAEGGERGGAVHTDDTDGRAGLTGRWLHSYGIYDTLRTWFVLLRFFTRGDHSPFSPAHWLAGWLVGTGWLLHSPFVSVDGNNRPEQKEQKEQKKELRLSTFHFQEGTRKKSWGCSVVAHDGIPTDGG